MSLSKIKKDKYLQELKLPLIGDDKTNFCCNKCGIKLATGYKRIVIGDRGPYIEFEDFHIVKENIFFPKNQFHIYFDEYLSNCEHLVFIYHQRKKVSYADYKEKLWYISPNLLKFNDNFECIIEQKNRKLF